MRAGMRAAAAALTLAGCGPAPEAAPAGSPPAAPPAAPPAVPAPGAAAAAPSPTPQASFWRLPKGVSPPRVPASNPMSAAKVALGRRLFYEKRLSVNGTFSCASCHDQQRGFADGKTVPVGATGMAHPRNSMGLVNAAYATVLTWGNPLMTDLETQAIVPLTGDAPIEIGFGSRPREILDTLRADPDYAARFAEVFPGEAVGLPTIAKAIAAFERTMVSFDAPYDRARAGDATAMSPAARRGADLFFGERLECAHCHDGPYFTDSVQTAASKRRAVFFHNTGLFNLGPGGRYPPGGEGVYEVSRKPDDMGKFRAPSLRNVAVTAPYFHDGSAATLREALDHYAAGGRTIADGPFRGDGSRNPLKDPLIGGFDLTEAERDDVVAFLESLTDRSFLADPALGDPHQPGASLP